MVTGLGVQGQGLPLRVSAPSWRRVYGLLGGSWVVIGDVSPLLWVITIVILLITLLITNYP